MKLTARLSLLSMTGCVVSPHPFELPFHLQSRRIQPQSHDHLDTAPHGQPEKSHLSDEIVASQEPSAAISLVTPSVADRIDDPAGQPDHAKYTARNWILQPCQQK